MKIYYWLIRIFSILFFVFISLFTLDSIGNLLGFLIHLIPSFVIIFLIIIAWKHQFIGSILFIIIGLFSFFFLSFQSIFISFLIIGIGILFSIENYLLKIKKNEKNKNVSRKML